MKRAALATILCVLFSAATYAQQQNPADAPASKEDINRLLDAMHSRDTMMSVMNMMSKQIGSMVHQQISQNHDLPPDAEERINKMTQDMFKNFPVDDLIQAMIPVYQKHFTKGDIDAVVAFYSSPVGPEISEGNAGDHAGEHAGVHGRRAKNGRQHAAADSGPNQPDAAGKEASTAVEILPILPSFRRQHSGAEPLRSANLGPASCLQLSRACLPSHGKTSAGSRSRMWRNCS